MKIAYISTILPRECGIATFTKDLVNSMISNKETAEHKGIAVALNDADNSCDYDDFVEFHIRDNKIDDYKKAADYLNKNADLVMLQHEYNIFGGEHGNYILNLINNLNTPLITTLHTVYKKPQPSQRDLIRKISGHSEKVTVMSKTAARFCRRVYGIPARKLVVINHGIPKISKNSKEARKALGLQENQKIITSFGLLTRNKGIEVVIKALPKVIEKHKDLLFFVLGKTHPVIKKLRGERYRRYLERISRTNNVEDHVVFKNQFIDEEELNDFLAATDILITSYKNKDQISSGPLTFAMGAKTAVISTPFWNAQELLSDDRGKLFEFDNYEQLSEILLNLFDKPELMNDLKNRAYEFGEKITWPEIGKKYVALCEDVYKKYQAKKAG